MYKLSLDLDRKLEIMVKHSLTGEEWLFLELLFTAQDGQPEYMLKYFNDCKKDKIPLDTLKQLKDKKVLDASYRIPEGGQQFDVDDVEFSKTFINNYFKNSFEAGRELFDAYPEYVQGSDKLYAARNITSKGFIDENDLFLKYNKAIQYKVENHNEVMEMLKWAIENKLIQYSIVEYIVTRKWTAHKEMKDSGEIGNLKFTVETLDDI